MRIPEDKIQEIREATDIVEVVSQYVTLKKRGKSFMGLCPFHTEKTPSFSVDPVRGFYYCFGCGAGGNAFSFVMQMERVSFPEAMRSLAEKSGIPLPMYQENDRQIKETEVLYRANQFAAEFFRQCLLETEKGQKAQRYLAERGFSSEIIGQFEIGYAPDRWDGLLNRAEHASIRAEILRKAGLVVTRKDGEGYYDRFRGRIMFPILNPSGRVVGFGGRAIKEGEGIPKYINSPETLIYQKSRVLYGLFQSKTGIRREDRAILVEGYTDLMRLHQSGLDYGVATSGTALTEEQAKLLYRYTKKVTLVFDGDSAGFNAALRGVDVLVSAGFHVEVAPLPKGTDPDSFLRDRDRETMDALLKSSKSFIDFRLDQMREKGKLRNAGDKAVAARVVLDTVVRIRDPLEQNLMVKDVAEKLGVEEALLMRQLRKMKGRRGEESIGSKMNRSSARQAAEEGLLLLLLVEGDKWGERIFSHVEPDYFREREARIAMKGLYEGYLRGELPESKTLMDRYSEDLKMVQFLSKLLAEGIGEDVNRFQFGLDCLLSLKQDEIQERIKQVREKLKSAQISGEDVSEYSRKWIVLKKEMGELKNKIEKSWKKNVEI